MASVSQRIHDIRQEELNYYIALRQLSRVQREAIAAGRTDELVQATDEKQRIIGIITGLSTQAAELSEGGRGRVSSPGHECVLAGGARGPCELNIKIAEVCRELLEYDRESQALLEQAMNAVAEQIRSADRGGRAVRAYWSRVPAMGLAAVDDNV